LQSRFCFFKYYFSTMLKGKRILIGITGSIAAYKTPMLVRLLVKEGAEVRLIMTEAANDFVSRLTLSTLAKNPVLQELFDEESWANHVMLGRWADLFLIAPLSCNTLAKMATGLCDNLLLATYLSATCPVWLAPAMDEDMWLHPTTKNNLRILKNNGCRVIPAEHGALASGLTGFGRMVEPEAIYSDIVGFFSNEKSLQGKKALVTAGPTHESIDPVRFIGNHSTGKMGYAIAEELKRRGAQVTLVSGPVSINGVADIDVKPVTTAQQMLEACLEHADYDIAVLAAAVADYRPARASKQKIKKEESDLTIPLTRTTDILATLGKQKRAGQLLVGFALETDNERANALKKLESKGADMIVLNSLNDTGAGFGTDTNKVTIFGKDGTETIIETKPKKLIAKDIVDTIISVLK
jgi:phosphopantothenoylcysteine decarboxylase/phosphopantothenate--cysteine ligase